VHVVGLSILSGSHMELIPDVMRELEEAGAADVPLIVGGIIPAADEKKLLGQGVARVFTPKDFQVTQMMSDIVDLVAERHGAATAA
jgi:(2R)-ethylmalonyl-CoA mutase